MSDSSLWQNSVSKELENIEQILKPLGFSINAKQPHISGERFLMTKEKLVLVGKYQKDDKRVIIKVSKEKNGKEEIVNEKNIRDALTKIAFTNNRLFLSNEIYFGSTENYLIWITEFIEQDKVFAAHSIEEQFFMIMNVFDMQESFHANTFENIKIASKVFPIWNAETYLDSFERLKKNILILQSNNITLKEILEEAGKLLHENKDLVNTHCGYLTHTDLAPGNTRINKRKTYMIDLTSMLFGNKYEGWARFLNWAIIHSPNLEKVILEYVKANKDEEEYLSLQLMRIYKATFLIDYHAKSLKKTSGNLHILTEKRVELWTTILGHLLNDRPMPSQIIYQHRSDCSNLRSPEEIERQKEFNVT